MDNRKLACMVAAGFLGATLTAGATNAFAGPGDVVVEGTRIDPELQRKVFTTTSTSRSGPVKKLLTVVSIAPRAAFAST